MLLASGLPASSIAIIFAASGGVVGAIVTLLKLKPEANQSAVLQAQGAMETMVALQHELEQALERERERSGHYRSECARLERELDELQDRYAAAEALLGPFPDT
jgi:uncharacterized protein HemX